MCRFFDNIYVGIGANLNNPQKQVERAITLISKMKGIQSYKSSSLYLTKPYKCTVDQPLYMNAVASFKSPLSCYSLMEELKEIEKLLGKIPKPKTYPRPIDIDLLLYKEVSQDHSILTLPHPGVLERLFVLIPLRELTDHIFYNNTTIYLDDILNKFSGKEKDEINSFSINYECNGTIV